MSENIMVLTINNFEQEVIRASKAYLIDFWAPWCAPCRVLEPILEQLAEEYDGKLSIGKVNTDKDFDIALKFGVSSIPTLVLFIDGKEHARLTGLQTKETIINFINENATF